MGIGMIRWQSPSLRYSSAIVFPALALLASLLLRPAIDPKLFLPFIAAVFLTAWFYGMGAALLATLVSVLAADFVFLAPVYSFRIQSLNQAGRLTALAIG